MQELPPELKSFVGPTVFVVLGLIVWLVRWLWNGRKVVKEGLRQERKNEASDEFQIEMQGLDLEKNKTEHDKSLAAVWKEQVDALQVMLQKQHAEITAERISVRVDSANKEARIVLLESENVRCNTLTANLSAENAVVRGYLQMLIRAIEKKGGIDLDLSWMLTSLAQPIQIPPHVPNTQTVTINLPAPEGKSYGP